MNDWGQALSSLLGSCLFLLWLAFGIGSLLWVLSDAEERTNAGCAVALLVGMTWPVGLVVWLVLRPPKKPTSD